MLNFSDSLRKEIYQGILGFIFLFCHVHVYFVYSLESPNRGDSDEYTQHHDLIKGRKDVPKLYPFASWR